MAEATIRAVTLCSVVVNDPTADREQIGFDNDGNPIVRKRSRHLKAYQLVDLPDGTYRELEKMGAVRTPTELELVTGTVDRTSRPEFAEGRQ